MELNSFGGSLPIYADKVTKIIIERETNIPFL